jgi:acyl-CoA thioesterase-1
MSLLLSACVLFSAFSSSAASEEDPVILVMGDSLSAGFGMGFGESWPRLMQNRLDGNGQRYRVVNSSITGDTTQGGLARLPGLLDKYTPEVVIIELGGNDGLRGLSLEVTRANLADMIERSQAIGAQVLITGIMLPPNYGTAYTSRFHGMYGSLAEQYGLLLVPFFMEGVALEEGMMQADGVHPSAAAQPVLLENVWTVLAPVLRP